MNGAPVGGRLKRRAVFLGFPAVFCCCSWEPPHSVSACFRVSAGLWGRRTERFNRLLMNKINIKNIYKEGGKGLKKCGNSAETGGNRRKQSVTGSVGLFAGRCIGRWPRLTGDANVTPGASARDRYAQRSCRSRSVGPTGALHRALCGTCSRSGKRSGRLRASPHDFKRHHQRGMASQLHGKARLCFPSAGNLCFRVTGRDSVTAPVNLAKSKRGWAGERSLRRRVGQREHATEQLVPSFVSRS